MKNDLLNSEEVKRLRAAGTLFRQAWEKRHPATEEQKSLIKDALAKAEAGQHKASEESQGEGNQMTSQTEQQRKSNRHSH